MLAFAPMLDEGDFSAAQHIAFLAATLELYGRTLNSVTFLVGDNCSVNQCMARMMGVPMVGCASHRLNLAVRQFLDKQEATLDTIHAVMLRCRTVKNRAALRELTPLAPKLQNDTRWSSTFAMEQRFFAIKDELACIADLRSIFPSPGQIDKMQDLLAALEVIQGFTITLQRHDLAMNEARALLDTLVERFSGMASYLSPHASIVSNATFENAVVKVLDDDVGSMLECERRWQRSRLLDQIPVRPIPPRIPRAWRWKFYRQKEPS
ncbi:hypothetical protein AaE_009084 [Aphanomyces astaci]|uniref:HAT C-terminal dimerisation domain-containing protein n=1 Tax=Aphanomyces astaci TaxID=112090 RepID=A0A6A5A5Y2_APHAT|nr:hypothetical protein AaE_009084 [Aphanomyces astaci]